MQRLKQIIWLLVTVLIMSNLFLYAQEPDISWTVKLGGGGNDYGESVSKLRMAAISLQATARLFPEGDSKPTLSRLMIRAILCGQGSIPAAAGAPPHVCARFHREGISSRFRISAPL